MRISCRKIQSILMKNYSIVEFASQEEAQRAKAELSDKPFFGRSVFIREDREETARFGAPPIPGKIGIALGEARHFLGNQQPHGFHGHGPAVPNRNLFVGNVSFPSVACHEYE